MSIFGDSEEQKEKRKTAFQKAGTLSALRHYLVGFKLHSDQIRQSFKNCKVLHVFLRNLRKADIFQFSPAHTHTHTRTTSWIIPWLPDSIYIFLHKGIKKECFLFPLVEVFPNFGAVWLLTRLGSSLYSTQPEGRSETSRLSVTYIPWHRPSASLLLSPQKCCAGRMFQVGFDGLAIWHRHPVFCTFPFSVAWIIHEEILRRGHRGLESLCTRKPPTDTWNALHLCVQPSAPADAVYHMLRPGNCLAMWPRPEPEGSGGIRRQHQKNIEVSLRRTNHFALTREMEEENAGEKYSHQRQPAGGETAHL